MSDTVESDLTPLRRALTVIDELVAERDALRAELDAIKADTEGMGFVPEKWAHEAKALRAAGEKLAAALVWRINQTLPMREDEAAVLDEWDALNKGKQP